MVERKDRQIDIYRNSNSICPNVAKTIEFVTTKPPYNHISYHTIFLLEEEVIGGTILPWYYHTIGGYWFRTVLGVLVAGATTILLVCWQASSCYSLGQHKHCQVD